MYGAAPTMVGEFGKSLLIVVWGVVLAVAREAADAIRDEGHMRSYGRGVRQIFGVTKDLG